MADNMLQKIMLVEDEPDIQKVAVLALEAVGGFEVKVCSCGQEALETIADYSPDLVLLDVMMPNMDGPTTLKRLKEIPEFSNIPVVFMTAKVQPHEVEEYIAMGAVTVIAKPFNPMTLAEQVREAWGQVGS